MYNFMTDLKHLGVATLHDLCSTNSMNSCLIENENERTFCVNEIDRFDCNRTTTPPRWSRVVSAAVAVPCVSAAVHATRRVIQLK